MLFVDADVRLELEAAARAVALARAESADFVSAFPREITGTAGEALLVPLIDLVLLSSSADGAHPDEAHAEPLGRLRQFMLVRRHAYLEADGHRAVRGSLHDGIKLARRMKATGHSITVFDGSDIATCRMYAGFRAAWRGFSRNAYEAMGSPSALAAMIALNAGFFVLPFVALPISLVGDGLTTTSALWAAAAALALGIRTALAARFGAPAWTVVATPVAVLLMIGIQLRSFFNHCTGRPVVWRTRAYSGTGPRGET